MNKGWLVIRSHRLGVSFRLNRRVPAILLALALVTLAAMVISVGQGEYPIPPLEVVKTILGLETSNPDYPFIINTLRLPRTLVAFLVGVGLAISGTIWQGLTRNPLADPSIIGINAGASLAAVSLIVLLPSAPTYMQPWSAFGGAAIVGLLIYLLAWNQGSAPIRLILVGIGLAAIANALIRLMLTFGEINSVSQALVWLTGSVYGSSWDNIVSLIPWLIVLVPLALMLAQQLNVLNLGDDTARSLGSAVEWQRGWLLLISVGLTGAAVANAGTISFVGLIAPHLGRMLVGPTHEGLMPTAAVLGGAIIVLADLVGRTALAPIELPCGVVTAAIGAPYFLFLLVRHR